MIGAIITQTAVKSAFDALNKGDVGKMLAHWNEECTFFYPGKVKAGGEYAGKTQFKNWLENFFAQFPKRKYTIQHIGVENIFDLFGNNTVFVNFDLELTNKDGMNATNSGVSLITIKWTKVVKEVIYLKTTDGDEYKRSWGDIV